ncbi:hypothetical protein [Vreelandella zhaodongensis]|uniref:Uncharacterized protein n=1 Tax=Vreelandella zhaodongensis TaxID=1176240 RepID=A0ABX2SSD0_VREZH|nr:hypothetical protein [Halomonas zhaodongensis]NYS45022.1 hypothetical protein [Halomonas zhaodongensis]
MDGIYVFKGRNEGSMFTCTDWLTLHGLSAPRVKGIIASFGPGKFEHLPPPLNTDRKASLENAFISNKLSSQERCYRNFVVPALVSVFDNESEVRHLLCNHVEFRALSASEEAPYTICQGSGEPPVILMDWRGQPEDLLCLAHEAAHALQILLSNHELMPPVARETCAFIGELLLLDYVETHVPYLHGPLLDVWHSENSFYLGDCVDLLIDALNHPELSYHYYQNYPLARLAAVQMFSIANNESVCKLFSSGKEAMAHLPIDEMASFATEMENPFPVLQPSDAEHPVVGVYQSLGVMALLDIESSRKASYQCIESYYLNLLDHLQARTAFIALDNDMKPVGYTTWIESNSENNLVLTCQTALPNNRLNLQRALEQYISTTKGVDASYTRNASKEMLVW